MTFLEQESSRGREEMQVPSRELRKLQRPPRP